MGKISSFITFILSGLLGLGAVAAFSYANRINYGPATNETDKIENSLETEIEEQGLKVKRLATEVLENGDVVQSFTYSFEKPASASTVNESISVRSYYQDDQSDASAIIAVEKNEKTKTITVTNIGGAAFNRVIIVEIQSLADTNIKATVTCQYQKKLLDLSYDGDSRSPFLATSTQDIRELILDYSNDNHVSDYTLDFDYSSLDVSKLTIDTSDLTVNVLAGEVGSSGSFEDYHNWEFIQESFQALENLFSRSITTSISNHQYKLNEVLPSAQDIWDVSSNYDDAPSFHAFLKDYCSGHLGFRMNLDKATLTIDEDTVVKGSSSAKIYVYVDYDFSTFDLEPTGINTSEDELIY